MAAPTQTREALGDAGAVANYLNRSRKTLRNWRSKGYGPRWTGTGNGVRYRWRDVDAWLNEQQSP